MQTNTHSFAHERAAKLGPNHGYRIDGDVALLHAEIALDAAARTRRDQWALQLWACETPFDGGSLHGVKIAEAALPLSDADAPQRLDAEALARVPGGQRDYSMVLVLASGEPGAFDQIHDFANYPARERFITPHLDGGVAYQLEADDVVLRAESVRNPRDLGNLSGSLALELWAIDGAYDGSHVERGSLLASADLGRVTGGSAISFEQRVKFNAPDAGRWQVVLMLREWVPGGYVTRDFCAFAQAYVVAEKAQPVEVKPAPVEVKPAVRIAAKAAPIAAKRQVERPKAEAIPEAKPTEGRVSIMTGSLEELALLSGLTRKIAIEIVKGRPYASVDELTRVRGIGAKLLVKIRSQLTL